MAPAAQNQRQQNYHLGLAAVSTTGLWVLSDAEFQNVIASISWTDTESMTLSKQMNAKFEELLSGAAIDKTQIQSLGVLSGPGAFTGLRMSAAFAQGLSRALKISLYGIPTYHLKGKPFFIPLRHQQAKTLSLQECLTLGYEFLELQSEVAHEVKIPSESSTMVGLLGNPVWPIAEELLRAMKLSYQENPAPLRLVYGLEPKISGQR